MSRRPRERRGQSAALRERLEPPLERAVAITQATLAWFPVRVWRHFLQHNGFLLAAGVSYQGLFAVFAAIYVAFAVVGLWLGGSPDAVRGLAGIINDYIPYLIEMDGEPGLIDLIDLQKIATDSTSVLAVTGVVALGAALWTAIGFVTFARRAVRDIFALPFDDRSYVLLKARDLLAALVFGLALIVGSALITLGTYSLTAVFTMLDWNTNSSLFNGSVRVASVVVSFAINASSLGALFWFLTGTSPPWRIIWPGALIGGAGVTVLQLATGLLLSYTPANPLLATFTVFVGLMLWFRVIGVVMLMSASWIAVTANDARIPLQEKSPEEELYERHQALLLAAQVRVQEAQDAHAASGWPRRWRTRRALHRAQADLAELEASAPPAPVRRGLLFE
ncbi:YihY/virulence factor BrkB family protein [Microbacterium sp. No. 7]|uniref:YihY/virulence factor BrkB family protein n=1 Tax=Microbacterium sp. No. 7 TaxID=1714373 RepID=UPI000B2D7F8B|nr:YihY/virulence factor BrkB family protein [Microbacterium sp. No. 7]